MTGDECDRACKHENRRDGRHPSCRQAGGRKYGSPVAHGASPFSRCGVILDRALRREQLDFGSILQKIKLASLRMITSNGAMSSASGMKGSSVATTSRTRL